MVLFVLTLAVIFSCGCAGVLCSCYFKRAGVAIAASYAAMLILVGAAFTLFCTVVDLLNIAHGPHLFLRYGPWFTPTPFLSNLLPRYMAPVDILQSLVCALIHVLLGLCLLVLAWRHIAARWGLPRPVKGAEACGDKGRETRATSFLLPDSVNPVFHNEVFRELALFRTQGLLVGAAVMLTCLSAALILHYAAPAKNADQYFRNLQGWLILQSVLALLAAPLLFAGLFSKEYERGTRDNLRMTLLTPRQVVTGKGLAAVLAVLLLVDVALISSFPLFLKSTKFNHELRMLLTGQGTLLVCALLAGGVALFSSVLCRKVNSALLMSYALLFWFGIGNYWIAIAAIRHPNRWSSMGHPWWVTSLSPLAAFGNSANSIRYSHRMDPHMTNWAISMGYHIALALCFVLAAYWLYNRRCRKGV